MKYCRALGVKALKMEPPGVSGYPDRLVLLPQSRVAWVELKSPTGELSDLQKHRIQELQQLRHKVFVTSDAKEGAVFITKCLEELL